MPSPATSKRSSWFGFPSLSVFNKSPNSPPTDLPTPTLTSEKKQLTTTNDPVVPPSPSLARTMSWKLPSKLGGKAGGGAGTNGKPTATAAVAPPPSTPEHPGNSRGDGATTPTPQNQPRAARSGVLTIRIVEAKALTLPQGQQLPASIQKAIAAHGSSSISAPGASPASVTVSASGRTKTSAVGEDAGARRQPSKRESVQRRQQAWWLPYVVLQFDKNDVMVDALGGDVEAPVYMFRAHFDVSRESSISLSAYLRTSPTTNSASSGKDMGDDLFLGGLTFTPDFTIAGAGRVTDRWFTATTGQGEFHVQAVFKIREKPLSMEDFELLRVIGKGSFGKVMQVRKKDTARIYALKTIRKAHIVSRSEVTHTLAERSVLAQVNNPFITPLKLAFQSPDKLYIVLAFINGGELFHHLQREGRFSEERSRFYAAELLCALECLHGFNVVYRDLKPENILLDYTGHISLCDFGLAKLDMSETETTNTFCGTPEYLAPELLLGQGYNRTVDWWTLGVLLYEMMTGLPPFYDEDVPTMYKKILQNPLIFPDDMPSEARSVLTGLLNRDPSKRLGSRGAEEIKRQPFFANHLDWKLLMAKKIQPPFKPSVENAVDTSNFDTEFTDEPVFDSVVEGGNLSESVQKQFEGFTFQDAGMAHGDFSIR